MAKTPFKVIERHSRSVISAAAESTCNLQLATSIVLVISSNVYKILQIVLSIFAVQRWGPWTKSAILEKPLNDDYEFLHEETSLCATSHPQPLWLYLQPF